MKIIKNPLFWSGTKNQVSSVPAFGVLFSAVLLGEPILISMVVGGLIAVLGVSLVNKK
ncbi:hypothetical protein [Polynucleobacter campilacus]|uniref:hypothetical protein n=1 Tax=Polynucleobacter campilacus TaxID=1743163 RepID=UPI0013748377|nr:hypothetical protein [Polynucleobacter campilacus]